MSDYENPWVFDDQPFTSKDIGKSYGFVYLITDQVTGKMYVGRKYFWSMRKKKGATKRKREESDWKSYYGSGDEIKALVKEFGQNRFSRQILSVHSTRGDVNYSEVREQFRRDVLEKDEYINANINGKWFRKPQHIIAGRRIACSSRWSPQSDTP
jgi:hypothetical protein